MTIKILFGLFKKNVDIIYKFTIKLFKIVVIIEIFETTRILLHLV